MSTLRAVAIPLLVNRVGWVEVAMGLIGGRQGPRRAFGDGEGPRLLGRWLGLGARIGVLGA